MNRVYKIAITYGVLSLTIVACRVKITPLTPPTDPTSICQVPPIEKNIIGTWRFETLNWHELGVVRKGTVTFTSKGIITDPDSLFENSSITGKVITKTYDIDGTYPAPIQYYKGKIFVVRLLDKHQRAQTWPLYVASNECKQIVIYHVGYHAGATKQGFTLIK